MTEPTPAPITPQQELDCVDEHLDRVDDRLDRLEAENHRLRAEVDALRAGFATEVRTRRLVVETPDGFERITADSDNNGGALVLHVRPRPNESHVEPTSVRLYADEECYSAGVHLTGPGDSGGMWDVSEAVSRTAKDGRCNFSLSGEGWPKEFSLGPNGGLRKLVESVQNLEDWSESQEEVLERVRTVLIALGATAGILSARA